MAATTINYSDRIPNNVNLSDDRTLQRALEQWQPNYLNWWKEMGPTDFNADQIYLRTAVSVEQGGWAHFDYVKMPDYRWGIFLAPPEAERTIGFGDVLGKPADVEDAVRLVRLRGQAMQEAVPPGEGAMAAVMGLAPDVLEAVCAEAAATGVVSPANFNAPGQIVIAGQAAAVKYDCSGRTSRLPPRYASIPSDTATAPAMVV